ncbi:MAG: V-type ATP synthase subunit E [Candidatus Delongbacteria bacterium]|nr:V-type ATP synthase subunit E [Candidatus Delongbacteria bacterium]
MESKLQELTERIYNEGVVKAREEAEQIKAKARQEAEKAVKEAQKEANAIIEQAEKRSEEIRKNVQSEVKLAAQQAISAIKQQIVNLITAQIVEPAVQDAFKDTEFLKKIILTAVQNWAPHQAEKADLALFLPKQYEKDLEAFFLAQGAQLVQKGILIQFDEEMKGGFTIGPKDGAYKVSFTDEDFENFFKTYLRPRTIRVLYGGQ